MEINKVLSELRMERDRITQAIAAIEALTGTGEQRSGKSQLGVKPRRTMSAAARKRISEAAKRRWAERKKAAVKNA